MMLYDSYKHSHNSGNTYRTRPSMFVWKYGLRNFSDELNASTALGRACHYGAQIALMEDLPDNDAIFYAKAAFDKLMVGEVTKERECIESIILRFLQRLRPLGAPSYVERELVISGEPYGLKYPIKIVTDIEWPEFGRELKTGMRCPSKIGDFQYGHVLQAAAYTMITGKPFDLLYASHANSLAYTLTDEDLEGGWRELLAAWRRIEALDRACLSAADAMDLIPFCAEQFWDPGERRQARRAWDMARAMGDEGDSTILAAG